MAFGAQGEILEVVATNGQLTQFDGFGAHGLAGNVLSAGVAFAPGGTAVLDVIFEDGTFIQFDALGAHNLGKGD